jgi:hypothetical protein
MHSQTVNLLVVVLVDNSEDIAANLDMAQGSLKLRTYTCISTPQGFGRWAQINGARKIG